MGPPWDPRGYRPSARDFTHACRHLTEERQAAQAALKSLRRVQTATKVGLNKAEYSKQVIEMAQTVDELLPMIPVGTLQKIISEARDQYVDAQDAWDTAGMEFIDIFIDSRIGKKLHDT
jgi:hypothetical protein